MTEEIIKETIFEQYQREITADLELDRVILEDKQLKLPGIKGKWVARLMNHKKEIDKLQDLYEQAIKNIAVKIIDDSPIKMSEKVAMESAHQHELPIKIKKEIKDHVRIVEYLEKLEKILSSMSYDISNIISLIKLETC